MKEFDDHKDWTSQYHPTGLLNQGTDSPLAKGIMTVIVFACMAVAFVGVIGLIWWVYQETYTFEVVLVGSLFIGPLSFFIWLLVSFHRTGRLPHPKWAVMCFAPTGLTFIGYLALQYWYFIPREGIQ